jgi:uncharacterized protein YndB with AHSA1/START domain
MSTKTAVPRTCGDLDRTEVSRLKSGATQMPDVALSVVHATFRLERVYEAPPSRVWKALTQAEAKAKWFAGTSGQWDLLEREMDVRPGGRERLKGRWQSGIVTTFDAAYHDVIAEARLVYSYNIELKRDGSGTRLTVTEQGAFLDGYDDAGSREHGTGILLDYLGASLKD